MPRVTYAEFRKEQTVKVLQAEIKMLAAALKRARGNVAAAARELDVSEQYVQQRITELKLRKVLASIRAEFGYVPRSTGLR